MEQKSFDVIIIGGSYAGLQAALTLARSLWNVLVIDEGKPANTSSPNSHNMLLHDGDAPATQLQRARQQVLAYPFVNITRGKVDNAYKDGSCFIIKTEDGQQFTASKLLLATGLKDILPDIKGMQECWGKSVIHCPYCHGYELRSKQVGLMSFPAAANDFLPLVYNLNPQMSLFMTEDADTPLQKYIEGKGITVHKEQIIELLHEEGQLHTVLTREGGAYPMDALFLSQQCVQHHELAEQLGCKQDDKGFIEVGIVGQTNIDGLFAAGDCTSPMRAISVAIAAGYKAGIAINNELLKEAVNKFA